MRVPGQRALQDPSPGRLRSYDIYKHLRLWVIGHERTNPDRANDPETHPDHGESSHGVWLRYRQTTVLASPEQLRFATADEQLLLDELPPTMVTTPNNLGPRQYLDIRDEAPIDGQPPDDHGNQEGGW